MSTSVNVAVKPPKFSIGTIASILPTAKSKNETSPYYTVAFQIQPDNDPEGRTVKGWFTYHPQFLEKGFLRSQLDSKDDKKLRSLAFVFDMHIGFSYTNGKLRHAHPWAGDGDTRKPKPYYGKYCVPTLVGLFGEETNGCDEITNQIHADGLTGDEVIAALDTALGGLVGRRVGYIETQQEKKTDQYNDRGYPLMERTNFYQFEAFFIPSKAEVKRIVDMGQKVADRSKVLITFDGDVPFQEGYAAA